jgi:hypothetical protein
VEIVRDDGDPNAIPSANRIFSDKLIDRLGEVLAELGFLTRGLGELGFLRGGQQAPGRVHRTDAELISFAQSTPFDAVVAVDTYVLDQRDRRYTLLRLNIRIAKRLIEAQTGKPSPNFEIVPLTLDCEDRNCLASHAETNFEWRDVVVGVGMVLARDLDESSPPRRKLDRLSILR